MPSFARLLLVILVGIAALSPGAASLATPVAEDAPPAFFFEAKDSETSWFELEAAAGETADATVIVGIDGDRTIEATTFVADAFTLTNGGFGASDLGTELTGPSLWVSYPTADLTLEPDQLQERTLSVTVPPGTAPGQYLASIVVQTAEPVAVPGSDMLRQTIRKALAVLITVPGPVEAAFSIGDPTIRHLETTDTLVIGIENTGNVLVKPAGTVTVLDSAGAEVLRAPVAMGSVYAGTATTLEIQVPVPLETGEYIVRVELTDAATNATASSPPMPLSVTALDETQVPVTVDAFTVTATTDDAGAVQLANVGVRIGNAGAPIPSVKLTLGVFHDGTAVEDYVLNPSLALPSGVSNVEQRYIPATGWAAGTWTFTLTVEAIDLATGQSTIIQVVDAPDGITVE